MLLRRLKDLVAPRVADPDAESEGPRVPLHMRLLSALMPLLAFAIVVYQVYSSADTDRIMNTSGVQTVSHWSWSARHFVVNDKMPADCVSTRCWLSLTPNQKIDQLALPAKDPLGTGTWGLDRRGMVVYSTEIPPQDIAPYSSPLLYVPGIRADDVYVHVNGELVMSSAGNLPLFVRLPKAVGSRALPARVEIVVVAQPSNHFTGFIRQELFVGSVSSVYRAHYFLSFRSFPRHASILFLLATGALTFAFFVFLDQKRELFALGVTISSLGVAEAIRVGIVPAFGSRAFFSLFAVHIACLAWYGFEIVRTRTRLTRITIAAIVALIPISLLTTRLPEQTGTIARFALLLCLNGVPLAVGLLCASVGLRIYAISKERALQIMLASLAMIGYSLYLYASDFQDQLPFKVSKLNETPVLLFNAAWIIAALASLGSLERRVQRAVEDRQRRFHLEQELALAEEVQKSFILAGEKPSAHYEVYTVYKAARSVGGDWVTWHDLNGGYALGIIGDIVGKGTQAGLIVSACDSTLHMMLREVDPAQIGAETALRRIVDSLQHAVISRHQQRAMTLAIMILTPDGEMVLANLGHPPLLGISQEGIRVLTAPNSWLNAGNKLGTIRVTTVKLRPGETVLGYTDGVCDGSRQLKHFKAQWVGWENRDLQDFLAEFDKLTPDYDDQSILLFRRKANAAAA